jgi:hypothetical protein
MGYCRLYYALDQTRYVFSYNQRRLKTPERSLYEQYIENWGSKVISA